MKAIAEKKKAKNIGEYIIYMYQMEDLIRAYQFNMQEIKQYVVAHYPISEEEKDETFDWFAGLANSMAKEDVKEYGHLKSVQQMVDLLAKLHWKLLKTDISYFNIYQKAKPHIIKMVIEAGENSPGNEIQICINAIYGLLLAKLRGREIPQDMVNATDVFGDVLSYLNWVYFEGLENKAREN
jgi:hypothetical protein